MTADEILEAFDDVDIPKPHIVPSPYGIEWNWSKDGRHLRLILPTKADAYLFYKQGDDYGLENSRNFTERLMWLIGMEGK